MNKAIGKIAFLTIISIVIVLIPKNTWAVTGSDVVNIAKGEVGQVTGSPNKYTYWNGSINGSYSYAWCHAFVSWCGAQAGAGNIIPKTASCAEGYKYFVSKGQWKSRNSGYIPKSGDIIYFDYGSNGTYDHVGIVDYVSSGRVHTIEGNAGNAVKKDGGYSNGYSLSNIDILGYGVPAYEDGNKPQGYIDIIQGKTGAIYVKGWAFDRDNLSKSLLVSVYIGGPAGVGEGHLVTANKSYESVETVYPGVGKSHGFEETLYTDKTGSQTVYIYISDEGSNYGPQLLGSQNVTITKDTEKPTISNVQVSDHSKNGYTITCDVSDNVGISKVLFPTWNDSEGTANAKWLEGTVSGGKATVRVNVSDWDNKEGIYYTDIYARDNSGNEACYSRITRYIDRTPPTISEVKVTSMDVDGYTVSCKVTDNKTMSRVQFPTWTRENDQDDLNPAWETDSKASGMKDGNYYTYRVNISEHNQEKGPYVTHIYAYDLSGNSTKCDALADVTVPNYGISEGQNVTVSKETFRISGWVTDTRGISKITYKINGGTENDFSLEQKTGVAFTSQINTVNCKAGSNTVDITVYPKMGNTYKIPTVKVTVAIQPFAGKIDAPEADTINSGDSITVKGWAICGVSITKNTAYIDGKDMGQLTQVSRTDVAEKYPNCTNMKGKEGYSGTLNISSLADGKHTLKIVSTTNNSVNYEKSIVYYKTGENFAEANFTAVIKNAGSGKVLTVRESDNNVLSNSASGTPAQTWKFIKKTSTSYAIQNTATGKYLYSTGKSGDNVAVKDASGDTIPKWELYKAKSGGYYLKPMASSSSMLDLTDGSTAENANIRIYQYNAGNAQRFTLEYQVESVALNKTTAVLTEKGQTVQLTASVLPDQAKDKTVTWTSSDLSVATVNSSGLVTAVGNGTATITVNTNNSAKTATCKVTVTITASDDITGSCGENLTWRLSKDGVLTISGTGAMKHYNGKTAMPWYAYKDQIRTVVIEDGVTSIGNYAFYGMPGMTGITIPESVTSVGDYSFKSSTALKDVVLPQRLTKLGESAFYGCTSLDAIDIPASLYTVRPYTFKNCTELTSVTFHEGNLQKLSDAAFYGTALTEVAIPDCATIIDVYCFKNCKNLASVKLSSNMTQIREAVFYGTALTDVKIPEGVTKVGPYAFKNCTKMEGISLPTTLVSVEEASFYACTALKQVVLPDAVTSIENYAFRGCEKLASVVFSENLEVIGESSFYGCVAMANIAVPESVSMIKGYAFKGCTGLKEITLPDSLTVIGASALYGCTGLTEITIPKNVSVIGDYTFANCTGLGIVRYVGNAPVIGERAFSKVNAQAFYPADNSSWTPEVMQNYGGGIEWIEENAESFSTLAEGIGEENNTIESETEKLLEEDNSVQEIIEEESTDIQEEVTEGDSLVEDTVLEEDIGSDKEIESEEEKEVIEESKSIK